jgi:hypothetical protein
MKTTILIVLLAMVPLPAQGQGTIYFSNHVPSSGINAPVFGFDGVTRIAGPAYQAQLWVGGPGAGLPDFVPVGAAVPMGTGQLAGYYDTSLDPVRVIAGTPPGTHVWVQARVWAVEDGATLEEVVANHPSAAVSLSSQLWVQAGDSANPAFMGGAGVGVPWHFWYPASVLVPEPSVCVLLGLSGLLLVPPALRWRIRRR